MNLSKNKIKYLNSLNLKKNRDKDKVFIAEGIKIVNDLLPYFNAKIIVATQDWLNDKHPISEEIIPLDSIDEMKKISLLSSPSPVFAVFYQPEYELQLNELLTNKELILALDTVQDPGNLGTIIRTCDWFGVHNIICSRDTAECYNPKVVQATMGALARVNLHYVDNLAQTISHFQSAGYPIYGTLLDGQNMYHADAIPDKGKGIIIMGNEGNGISMSVRKTITHPIFIPSYPANVPTSESLNVGIATAIVLAEFRRQP